MFVLYTESCIVGAAIAYTRSDEKKCLLNLSADMSRVVKRRFRNVNRTNYRDQIYSSQPENIEKSSLLGFFFGS